MSEKLVCEALVLRRSDYSETSQVAVLFTAELGRVSVLAKGIKRPNAALKGPFDLFQRNEVEILPRRSESLQLVTRQRILDGHAGLRRDLERLYAAFYLTELLREGTRDFDPDPDLFALAADGLAGLAGCDLDEVPLRVLHFELHFLNAMGFGPSWFHCLGCGREAGPRGDAGFSLARGGLVCRSCRPQLPGPLVVISGALRGVLRRLVLEGERSWRGLRAAPAELRRARAILDRLLERHLEREIRSAGFL